MTPNGRRIYLQVIHNCPYLIDDCELDDALHAAPATGGPEVDAAGKVEEPKLIPAPETPKGDETGAGGESPPPPEPPKGEIKTYSTPDKKAKRFRTPYKEGPKWSHVTRRITKDAGTGEVIED